MYTSFYNLREKPFELTPSPRFLYLGEIHKEALALLTYGVMDRKGFVLLTGEVGTGKTTIVQTLLKNLNSSSRYVYLSNPLLSSKEFLLYVASSLGFEPQSGSKASFLVQFQEFLSRMAQDQQNVILIVDEAQKLSYRLLEEVRLLSNMETTDEKLINIFLIGQPELNERLMNPKCRPLLQRISVRYHINPLDQKETDDYIKTRLKAAGAKSLSIFPKDVVKLIHEYSQGYPRMINVLCDNALLLGYSRGKKNITPAMIKECYEDLQLPLSHQPGDSDTKKALDLREQNLSHPIKKRSFLRPTFFALILVIVIFIGAFTSFGRKYVQSAKLFCEGYFNTNITKELITTETQTQRMRIEKNETSPAAETVTIQEKAPEPLPVVQESQPALVEEPREPYIKAVTVKPGDTLLGLSMKVYGYADDKLLTWLQKENPEIRDVDFIEVGQKIVFSRPPQSLETLGRPVYSVHVASFKPLALAQSLFEKLRKDGYDAYVLPFIHPEKGKMFRVAIGAFTNKESAEQYGKKLRESRVVDYAEAIRIDMI
jgi:type II secretory pathway predicted ATPase ExeA